MLLVFALDMRRFTGNSFTAHLSIAADVRRKKEFAAPDTCKAREMHSKVELFVKGIRGVHPELGQRGPCYGCPVDEDEPSCASRTGRGGGWPSYPIDSTLRS